MFTLKGGDFITNKFPQKRWGIKIFLIAKILN